MRIQDLLNLDISKLTSKNIAEIGHYAQRQVNRQMSRWENKEYKSPAYYALKKSGGKISFANKSLNQKKAELARAIRFLRDPSRTFSGWAETKEDIAENIGTKTNINISPENFDALWKSYEKAKELNGTVGMEDYKYQVIQTLNEILQDQDTDLSIDELALRVTEDLEEMIANKESQIAKERESISAKFK